MLSLLVQLETKLVPSPFSPLPPLTPASKHPAVSPCLLPLTYFSPLLPPLSCFTTSFSPLSISLSLYIYIHKCWSRNSSGKEEEGKQAMEIVTLLRSYSLLLPMLLFILLYVSSSSEAYNVTYDRRSLLIDGQRKLLISASIHYPRSVPAVTSTSLPFLIFF